MKENFKLEKKEIIKLNDKIKKLNNEIEIKKSKIEYIDKRHKNLQSKFIKLLRNKNIMELETISNINKNFETIKSYNSIKLNENNNNKIEKNNSKDLKINNEIFLPEISQNKSKLKTTSLQKYKYSGKKNNKNNIKNKALKDLNNQLTNFSKYKNNDEEFEDEGINNDFYNNNYNEQNKNDDNEK